MQHTKGFTVIEVAITLIVIAILMAALASQLVTFRIATTETSNNQQVAVVQQMVDMEFSRLQLANRSETCENNYKAAVNTVRKQGLSYPYAAKQKILPNGATYTITITASGSDESYDVTINNQAVDTRLLSASQICGYTKPVGS